MPKKINAFNYKSANSVKRPGVHAKTKTSKHKESPNYKKSYSAINEGVCTAFNKAATLSTKKYIILAHDDMYFCPGWDEVFNNELSKIKNISDFFLSGTMVQPFESYINLDCGQNINEWTPQTQ